MHRIRSLSLWLCLVPAVVAPAQDAGTALAPILAGSPARGLPGAKAGTERWIVQFATRTFDLTGLRGAIEAGQPANAVAAIVADLEQRMRTDQAPFVQAVGALGGAVVRQWWLVNAAAVEIDPRQLDALRRLPNVLRVQPDEAVAPAILTATNANNHAADALQAQGHRGQGATVGIVDTGQDSNLGGTGRPHRMYFVNGDPLNTTGGGIGGSRLLVNRQIGAWIADDQHGHGTGVASIAAGANWGTAAADNGHAPSAGLAGYSIANSAGGFTDMATMTSAWQQLAADRATYNIVAANMSYSAWPDPLHITCQAIDSAGLNADVLCVVAAGNSGASTVGSCGATNGLAVAALNANAHTVAGFSSRGPMSGDPGRTYPDIAACGVNTVMALRDNESTNYTDSGTSMAAPQVAGAATQLRARFPSLTALQSRAVLMASVRDLSTQNPGLGRNDYGVGLLRNDRAHTLAAAGQFGTATVASTAVPHTFTIPVQAGFSYRIAIAWNRRDLNSTAWSNLDLQVLDPAANVLAQSTTPRNLYEVVLVYAPFTGNLTVRTSAATLGPASPEPFAWAWMDSPGLPVPGSATAYGAGCAPVCSTVNGSGTLAPLTHPFEFAYAMPPSPGMQVTAVEVFTSAATAVPTGTVLAIHGNFGGGISPAFSGVTTVTIGTAPGFYRATFAAPINVPAGPWWVSIDHRQLTTNLSNLTTGTTVGGYQRPTLLSGPWTPSPLVVRPAFRVYCQTVAGGGSPLIGVVGTPTIGTTLGLNMTRGPANGASLLALGYSNTTSAFGPLPFPLELLGAPSCWALTSGDSLDFRPTDAAGAASGSLVIPNLPTLVGFRLYAQYVAVSPGGNALGLTFSNASSLFVGN